MKENDLSQLNALVGGIAKLWLFTSDGPRLVVRILGRLEEERVYLVLDGCVRIQAPTAWRFNVPTLKQTRNDLWVLEDEKERVRIVFDSWSLRQSFDER